MITRPEQICTGADFEEFFFLRRHTGERCKEYLRFEAAYAEAKKDQGENWDPLHPSTLPAQRLLNIVKEQIGYVHRRIDPDVRLYRLIGTKFDSFHGVDAAIEYGKYRVFIDITIRPWKETIKGVYIITLEDVMSGRLEEIGLDIAYDLLTQEKNETLVDIAFNINLDIDSDPFRL